MSCRLCRDQGYIQSPTTGAVERCACARDSILLMVTFAPGVERFPPAFCLLCDPHKLVALQPGQWMLIERRAWLPDGGYAHWDPGQRGLGVPFERTALCGNCAAGTVAFLKAGGGHTLARTVSKSPTIVDAHGRVTVKP